MTLVYVLLAITVYSSVRISVIPTSPCVITLWYYEVHFRFGDLTSDRSNPRWLLHSLGKLRVGIFRLVEPELKEMYTLA